MTNLKQSQFELFPGSSSTEQNVYKKPFIIKDLTLSAENIIVLSIIFLVSLVVFFSFGVERGKSIALKGTQMPVATTVSEAPVIISERTISPDSGIAQKPSIPVTTVKESVISEKASDVKQTTVDEKSRYTIQVASFKKEDQAKDLAKALETKGHKTFVMPKGTYSIVCVGQFAGKTEAEKYSRKIKNRYSDYVIRRL